MYNINNVDTFIFLLNIENYKENCKKFLDYLKNEKQLAQINFETTKDSNYIVNINNLQFNLSRTGTKGYAFILDNDNYNICIAEYVSNIKNYKPIKIRITSQALWNLGILKAYNNIIKWVEETFGKIIQESVYRIDLAYHSNNDFITNYDKIYKGHFKKKTITNSGNKINAICFGSRKNNLIYCRIYNKSLEIKETRNKTWFNHIWANANLDINNVWNLEFEIKSEFLRSKHLVSFQDVYEHIQDLWKYCTTTWLLKVIPNKTRISRCNISSDWLKIQKGFSNFISTGFIDTEQIYRESSQILIPTIAGYLTSYSANKNLKTINSALLSFELESKKYFSNKNTTFEKEVLQKIKLKGENTNDNISKC